MYSKKPDQGFILPVVLVMSSFISFALATDLQSYIYDVQLAKITQAKYQMINTMEVSLYDALDGAASFADVPSVINTTLEDKTLRVKTEWSNLEDINPVKKLLITGQWLRYDGEEMAYKWTRTALVVEREQGLQIIGVVL